MLRVAKYQRPQKGNPHQLVVKQHVFPYKCLSRFLNDKKCLDLLDFVAARRRFASPGDEVFCAMRAWSQREEKGFMRQIEADFEGFALPIISGLTTEVRPNQFAVINRFYALWYMRSRHRTLPEQEIKLNGIATKEKRLTRNEEEILESKGVSFVRANGMMLARQAYGMRLQMDIDWFSHKDLANTTWGVVGALSGQFLIPSVPHITVIPLTPTLSLCANSKSGMITKDNLAAINRAILGEAQNYVCARNLFDCPIA